MCGTIVGLIGDRTVRTLWDHQRGTRPDGQFLVFKDADGVVEEFTHAAFDDWIGATARTSADDLGVTNGDRVSSNLDNSLAHLAAWYALMKSGAIRVHSNPNPTVWEVNSTVDRSDAKMVVTEPSHLDVVEERTGDGSRFNEDGYPYFVDWKKTIVATRGENVSETEIKGVLEGHRMVAAVGVIGALPRPVRRGGQSVRPQGRPVAVERGTRRIRHRITYTLPGPGGGRVRRVTPPDSHREGREEDAPSPGGRPVAVYP